MRKTSLLLLTAIISTGCQKPQMAGITTAAQTLSIPILPSYGVATVANVYLICYDIDTGYLADGAGASQGVTAIDTTWANAAITCAAGDTTGAGTNVFTAVCTMPTLDSAKRWAIVGFENAIPKNTDSMKIPPVRYNPITRSTFTDSNMTTKGEIYTREALK